MDMTQEPRNSTNNEIYEKVKRVNALLQSQEPDNISVDDYGGYTGYKPQSIIDTMNQVFGLGMWGFRPISNEIVKDDKGGALAVAKVQVFIVGVAWEPEAWGQNRVTKGDQGDARKGADTDGWKKGLSFFSIGNRAYHGLLPDKKEQEEQRRRDAASHRQASASAHASTPAPAAKPTEQNSEKPEPTLTVAQLRYMARRELGSGAFDDLRGKLQSIYKDVDLNVDDAWQDKHCKHMHAMIKRMVENNKKQPVAAGASGK